MNSTISEEAGVPAEKTDGPSLGHWAACGQAMSGLKHTRMRADAFQAEALRKAREAAAQADTAIRDHPYRAMGIAAAAAAALVAGWLAARR